MEAVYCLLFRGKTFPFVAVFTLLVLVSIADTIGAAAFCDICHTLSPFSSCPEPRIETVFRDADASADPKNTKFGSAVAQIVGRAQADGQHLCDLLYRVHQCCGFQAVSRRLVWVTCFSVSYRFPIRYFLRSGVRLRRPSWWLQIQIKASWRLENSISLISYSINECFRRML